MSPTLDLRRQAAADGLVLTGDIRLTEQDRQRAIATWKGRMVNEHISARVFASLIPQMMSADLDPDWQLEVAVMVQDELRHGRQCAAVVHALGGEARAALPELPAVPLHEDAGPLEAFLRNLISVSCLSETVAVALIRAEQQDVSPPEMTATLGRILADEVQHARFGWKVMRELGDGLPADLRVRLGEYLVVALHHMREHELRHLPIDPLPTPEASAVGVCDGRDARSLFLEAVETVILPGLERHGIPARDAWRASFALDAAGAHPA